MSEAAPIEVRRYGSEGPLVVVLHGGPGAPGAMAPLARALAGEFRVLEPLQRRYGAVPLTVARHVADLAAVAPRKAHLVGHSWGAMLGLSFAARHPERVATLALVGCGTYDPASRAAFRRVLDQRLGDEARARIAVLKQRRAEDGDPAARAAAMAEAGRIFAAAYAFDPIETAERDADALAADAPGHDETWSDVLRLQDDGTEPAAFASIRAPVLMLHGDHDPHPGPAIRDVLARFVANLTYIELPRCGHEPWRERHAREPFLSALRSWLAQSGGRRPDMLPVRGGKA